MIEASLNRIILTYIRSVKYVEENELQEKIQLVYTKLQQQHRSAEQEQEAPESEPIVPSVSRVVETINKSIRNQGFKIVKSINEITNAMTYVFVNSNHEQEIDKQLSVFTNSEIYMIQLIIDEIFNTNYHIPPSILINRLLSVINHSSNNVIGNKSNKDISGLINRLIALGYLQLVNNAYLIMSIRLLSELKSYLTNRFTVLGCHTCGEIVTIGIAKEDKSFHYKCYDIYARSNRDLDNNGSTKKIGIEI